MAYRKSCSAGKGLGGRKGKPSPSHVKSSMRSSSDTQPAHSSTTRKPKQVRQRMDQAGGATRHSWADPADHTQYANDRNPLRTVEVQAQPSSLVQFIIPLCRASSVRRNGGDPFSDMFVPGETTGADERRGSPGRGVRRRPFWPFPGGHARNAVCQTAITVGRAVCDSARWGKS